MPNVGPMEVIALLVLALMLFGAKRLPEIGRGVGKGMREFKEGVSGIDKELSLDQSNPDHPLRYGDQ
jgi:TatA/E family protein of Tat protein translocase